jgi:hypothetical protein
MYFGESPIFQRNIFRIGKVSQVINYQKKAAGSDLETSASFLLGILFDPEERGGMFLRKVKLSPI